MAFIILSPAFSLFVRNILKLYSVIYTPVRLHGIPLLLFNQFLACSAGAKILPRKHSVAFILTQLGGVLISGHPYILLCLLSLGLHIVHICHCYRAEDMPSRFLVSIDKENCILQFHISAKKQIITEFIRQVQRRIYNPFKHLRWNFLRK